MKKLFLTSAFCHLTSSILFSQSYCGSARYDTKVFTTITVTSDVVYGWNKNVFTQTDTLKMDIYEPTGDTATIRPLIVMAHGGSFFIGDKTDMSFISTEMAKRGYVVASINYRLGVGLPIDSTSLMKAVWRATQDMKASVRFFRKDAATANRYRTDSTMIFIGGASAGGIMAVHYAYLDQNSEIPSIIDTVTLGGLEGNSGNAGYSSSVKAIVNICGAIADTCWMQPGDENMVSLQGNNDTKVPYCSDYVYLSVFKIMVIHGLGTMAVRANHIGIYNPTHTFYGQGHGSPGDSINSDTTVVLASDFLYKQMGCIPTNTLNYTNNPLCLTTLANTPSCLNLEVEEVQVAGFCLQVYPNPSNGKIQLISNQYSVISMEVYNVLGKKVYRSPFTDYRLPITIDLSSQPSGMYFMKCTSDKEKVFVTKFLIGK